MRTRPAAPIILCLLLVPAGRAMGQVLPDGRTADAPRRNSVRVSVGREAALRAMRRGRAPSADRIAAGKRDSLTFFLEKPVPRSWRRPKRQPDTLPDRPAPIGGRTPWPSVVVRASPTAAWVESVVEGPGFADVAFENGVFLIPPDPFVAAGPEHVAVVVNTSMAVYDREGGLAWRESLRTFFAELAPEGTLFDPRVRYDAFGERFIAVILELVGGSERRSSMLVAVSDGPDATGAWTKVRLDMEVAVDSVAHYADYPGLAVDEEAVYVTANLFGYESGAFGGTRLWIVDKTALYAGSDSSRIVLDPFALVELPELASTLQPAEVLPPGPTDSTGTWMMEYSGLTDGDISYVASFRVSDPLGTPSIDGAILELGPVDDFSIPVPTAPQPDTPIGIETNDRRMLDAVLRDGRLVSTATLAPRDGPDAGQATAFWTEVDVSDPLEPSLTTFATIGAEELGPGTSTYFPSAAIGPDGALLIGYSVSSPVLYAGAAAAGRLPDDEPGWLSAPTLVRAGDGPYVRTLGGGLNRWGDYSGVAADPTGDGTFWLVNEYSAPPGNDFLGEAGQWGTVLAHMAVDRRNTPPTALDSAVDVLEDTPTVFELQAFDADGDVPAYALVDGPNHGMATLTDSLVAYVPDPDYWGPDSLRFVVTDDQARSDSGLVRIDVLPVNDPPVAVDDSLETLEDIPATGSVASNDYDVDGDALTFTVVARPEAGSLQFVSDGSFTYMPPPEFGGVVAFLYRVTDPSGASAEATVTVTVVPVNDPPVAYPLVLVAYREEPILIPFNGADADGPRPTFELDSGPRHGSVSAGPQGLYYRADAAFVGRDSLTYRAFDGLDYSVPALVQVFVIRNRRPDAAADTYTVAEGETLETAPAGGVLANDSDLDGDPLVAVLVREPEHGAIDLASDGSFSYRHDGSETTADGFRYAARDTSGLEHEAEVTIAVLPVNDPPEMVSDTLSTVAGLPVRTTLSGTDAEHDPLVFRIWDGPESGIAVMEGDTLSYTPEAGFAGMDSLRVVADDGMALSEPAVVRVFVEGSARLQVLHAVPGTVAVFVRVDGQSVAEDLDPGTASPFVDVTSGDRTISVEPVEASSLDTLQLPARFRHGEDYLLAVTPGHAAEPAPSLLWRSVTETPEPGSVVLLGLNAWFGPRLVVDRVADTPDHAVLETLGSGVDWSDLSASLNPGAVNLALREATGSPVDTYRFDLSSYDGRRAILVAVPDGAGRPVLRILTDDGRLVDGSVVTGTRSAGLPESFSLRGVYPNPATMAATARIDVPQAGTLRLEIVDVLGRIVRSAGGIPVESGPNRMVPVDLRGMAAGVYAVRVILIVDGRHGPSGAALLVVH